MSLASWEIQFTARKRDPVTSERYRWRYGVGSDRAHAERWAARLRRRYRRKVKIEVIPARGGRDRW